MPEPRPLFTFTTDALKRLTPEQNEALRSLGQRYRALRVNARAGSLDLPGDYLTADILVPSDSGLEAHRALHCGIDREGRVSS